MKQFKVFLYQTAIVWVFIIFVSVFFGLPLWRELRAEELQSKEFYTNTLATFFLIAVAFVVLSRLKYWVAWICVLVVLAMLGTGVDLPPFSAFYPGKHPIVGASLTLVAILIFWFLEELVIMYTGADISHVGQSDNLIEEDEIITLNIVDEHRDAKTAFNPKL